MNRTLPRQHGMALVLALILLVALTLLGLSAMDSTMLEMKLAKNTQERAYAFNMAETALRENESLFTNGNFMSRLSLQADRTIDDDADVTNDYDGTALATPPTITRDVTNEIESATVPGRTMIEYKGAFAIPVGAQGSDWSVGTADGSYFEVSTMSRNMSGGGITMTVRSGYRQLSPTNPKVKTISGTSALGTIGY